MVRRHVCVGKHMQGTDAVMHAVAAATCIMSQPQQQAVMLEAIDAVQVRAPTLYEKHVRMVAAASQARPLL